MNRIHLLVISCIILGGCGNSKDIPIPISDVRLVDLTNYKFYDYRMDDNPVWLTSRHAGIAAYSSIQKSWWVFPFASGEKSPYYSGIIEQIEPTNLPPPATYLRSYLKAGSKYTLNPHQDVTITIEISDEDPNLGRIHIYSELMGLIIDYTSPEKAIY